MANKLKNLTINRADLVDSPSNPLARVVLFKRKIKKGMWGAKTTDGVLDSRMFMEQYDTIMSAFHSSVDSILYDGELDDKKRVKMLKDSVDEVSDHLKECFDMYPIEKQESENSEIYATLEKTVDVLQELDTLLTSGEISVEEVAEILGGLEMPDNKNTELEKAKTDLEAKTTELAKATEEITKLKGEVEKLVKAAKDKEAEDLAKSKATSTEAEDIWKGVNPAVKAQFEELKKKADENEKIAKAAEESAALAKISKRVETDLGGLQGTVDEKAGMFREIEKMLGSEKFEKLFVVLKSASDVIKKSALLDEKGATGTSGTSNSAYEKIKAKAAEILKAGQAKSEAEAITKVATSNPELYREYITEGVN